MLLKRKLPIMKKLLAGITAGAAAFTALPANCFVSADEQSFSETANNVLHANSIKNIGTYYNVTGDILSNGDICFWGYTFDVDGDCTYGTNINQGCSSLTYDNEVQLNAASSLPDIGDALYFMLTYFAPTFYTDGITFNWQENLDLTSICSKNEFTAYGRTISTQDIIAAKNNISFNCTDIYTNEFTETFLYSADGDITLQAYNIDMKGTIYAPNGKVLLSATNIDFEGQIIADEIEVNGYDISLTASEFNNETLQILLDEVKKTRILAVGDYNPKENKFTISWNTNQYGNDFTVWSSVNNGSYTQLAQTEEFSLDYIPDEGIESIDFYVEHTLLSGNSLYSNVVSLNADENGNYSVVMGDIDGDGLFDPLETFYGTDMYNPDTDKDGISDYDELYITMTNPLINDTDGNGISDGDEDLDGDGLSNAEEIYFGTNQFNPDTDDDGLSDYDEIYVYATDPLNNDSDNDGMSDGIEIEQQCNPHLQDTDGNGIIDGEEIYTTVKQSKDLTLPVSLEVTIDLPGKSIDSLSITETEEDDIFTPSEMPGYISSGYDLYADCDFESAQLVFAFDEVLLEDEGFSPAIYYCDIANQQMVLLENQQIDYNSCTVTASVEHFSRYVLINRTAFDAIWNTDIADEEYGSNGQRLEIAIAFDASNSMNGIDPEKVRQRAAKLFVDRLSPDDKAAIIVFDHTAEIVQPLTNNKELLYNVIDDIYRNGATVITAAMETALESLPMDANGAKQVIILITDADNVDVYKNHLTEQAAERGITVFAIGVGNYINTKLLNSICSATGGALYDASEIENLHSGLDNIFGQITSADSDGDGLNDIVEKNLYWFNGTRLNFDPNNPYSIRLSVSDYDVLSEYVMKSGGIYMAKLANPAYRIDRISEMLDANDAGNYSQDEICSQLKENSLSYHYGLLANTDGSHILVFHEDAHTYECIFCRQTFIDPNIMDKDLLPESELVLFYMLNRISDCYMNYDENPDIVYAIELIKDKVRNGYTIADSAGARDGCVHVLSGSFNHELYCTPYTSCDTFGNYASPAYYSIGYREFNLDKYEFTLSLCYTTNAMAIANVVGMVVTESIKDSIYSGVIEGMTTPVLEHYLDFVGSPDYSSGLSFLDNMHPDDRKQVVNSVFTGIIDNQSEFFLNLEPGLTVQQISALYSKEMFTSIISNIFTELPYIGKIVSATQIFQTYTEYVIDAVHKLPSLPGNYKAKFSFIKITDYGAARVNKEFDICHSYESYIAIEKNFTFYDIDTYSPAYKDNISLSEALDYDKLHGFDSKINAAKLNLSYIDTNSIHDDNPLISYNLTRKEWKAV